MEGTLRRNLLVTYFILSKPWQCHVNLDKAYCGSKVGRGTNVVNSSSTRPFYLSLSDFLWVPFEVYGLAIYRRKTLPMLGMDLPVVSYRRARILVLMPCSIRISSFGQTKGERPVAYQELVNCFANNRHEIFTALFPNTSVVQCISFLCLLRTLIICERCRYFSVC